MRLTYVSLVAFFLGFVAMFVFTYFRYFCAAYVFCKLVLTLVFIQIFFSLKLDLDTTTWRVLNRTVFKYGAIINKQPGTADSGRSTSLNV
jgi:hypothetical protein